MAAMSGMHREIHHLARRLHRSIEDLEAGEPYDEERVREIRRVLYGLDAVLHLHFAQEHELYATVAQADGDEHRVPEPMPVTNAPRAGG
jgi:hypothetical protein